MAAETPHPREFNVTLETLEADLAASRAAIAKRAAAERAAAEAEQELAAVVDAVLKVDAAVEVIAKLCTPIDNVIQKVPDLVRNALALESSIAARQLAAESDAREAREAIGRARHAESEAAAIEPLIALRKAQEARLGGVLGFGRPFGHQDISISREQDFIIDAMELTRGAIKTSVKRAAVKDAIVARAVRAKADAARWVKENEVVTFGVRLINYHGHDGRGWRGACLLRTLRHRVGNMVGFTVDPFAAMLQIPLSPDDVGPLVPAVRNEPPLASRLIMVDANGSLEFSPSPFQQGE